MSLCSASYRTFPCGLAIRSYDLVLQVQDGLPRFRSVPMLICWGERDFVFDHHFLAEWQRRFPQAEVHRFAAAGHYVLEDAGPAIIAAGSRLSYEPASGSVNQRPAEPPQRQVSCSFPC